MAGEGGQDPWAEGPGQPGRPGRLPDGEAAGYKETREGNSGLSHPRPIVLPRGGGRAGWCLLLFNFTFGSGGCLCPALLSMNFPSLSPGSPPVQEF